MAVRYYYDRETGLPHIWRHGFDLRRKPLRAFKRRMRRRGV
jgi:hypothetical protein